MTFNTWFTNLVRRNKTAHGVDPAGFKRLMKRLGNPQLSYQIIHVAGTNGKGSVCHLTAGMLQAAGYKTGLFVSPHVQTPTERISIDGQNISRVRLQQAVQEVLASEQEKLNFFEIMTAAAFVYFAAQRVDWVVLETGLGGRKDPTNICRPAASVITSIGLDHCAILGNTLPQIAREKAGIIKRGIPVFCPPLPREVLAVIRQKTAAKHAMLHIVREGNPFTLEKVDWARGNLQLKHGTQLWRLHLLGNRQVQNACLVYQLGQWLKLPARAIKQSFVRVQIPGRFEIIKHGKKRIILDGAHNPQAAENLVRFVSDSPFKKQLAFVCGFMADKDYPTMLRTLAHAGTLYVTSPKSPRAASLAQVCAALPRGEKVAFFGNSAAALRTALQTHHTVLVTGSFYLVGELRKRLG